MYSKHVKYELQEFERIMGSVARISSNDTDEIGCSAISDNLRAEGVRVKQVVINEVFGFQDEGHLERYIQYHQRAIIRLMDEAIRYRQALKISGKLLYQECYYQLEDLLAFIEKHFARYFDQNATAPETYVILMKKDIQESITTIFKALPARGADGDIVHTLLQPLRTFINDKPEASRTYRQVLYAREIKHELLKLVWEPQPDVDINEHLQSLMYYLNYNSPQSVTCHTRYIDKLVSAAETRSEKIEKLSYLLKRVNQAQVKPGISYNVYALDLTTQLKRYIGEELEHLRRIRELAPEPAASGSVFSPLKIQVEMTVAQVACLIRLLIDSKIVVNKNVTELLRFVSGLLVSKKTDHISYDSLRAKYYNVEQSTKEAVKINLIKMLSLIDKN